MGQTPRGNDGLNQASMRMRAVAIAEPVASQVPERHLAFRRFRLQQRFVPLLIAITLLSTICITSAAYFGARADATNAAESQAASDVRVEQQLINDQGAGLSLNNNQLQVGVDGNVLALNGDKTLVDRTRTLISGDATIYQLEGDRLVAISTNVPSAGPGTRDLGDALTGSAYDALLGSCGPTDTSGCHHPYQGIVKIHGVSYVAAFAPLNDMSGSFVGALGIAFPLDTVVAPTAQMGVLLAFVGLLVALLSLAGGYVVFGTLSRGMLDTLDTRLQGVAKHATELEQAVREQVSHAGKQGRLARQAGEQARTLSELAVALEQHNVALQQSAGGIWNQFSQPGLAINPDVALESARQAAISSAEVGTAAEEASDLCRRLVTLINHLVAESSAVADGGRDMETSAQHLRECVEQVEITVGEPLTRRRVDEIQQRFSEMPSREEQGVESPSQGVRIVPKQARARKEGHARDAGSQPRTQPGQIGNEDSSATGRHPGVRPNSSNLFPRRHGTLGDTAYGRSVRPGAGSSGTSEWRVPSSSQSRHSPSPSASSQGNSASGGMSRSDASAPQTFDSLRLPKLPADDPAAWNRSLINDSDEPENSGSSGRWTRR